MTKPKSKSLLSTHEIILIVVAIAIVVIVAAIFFVMLLNSVNTNQANSSYPKLSTVSYVIRELKTQRDVSSNGQFGRVSKLFLLETITLPSISFGD